MIAARGGLIHSPVRLLIALVLFLSFAISVAQDQSSQDQDETDAESIWIQAAFWPTCQNDTEPFFEVNWPTSPDDAADASAVIDAEHVIVPPIERHWTSQFTIAETIEQFPELIAPSDVLSLEIRQIQDSDIFAIVLEVDDQSFNVTRAVHYLDRLVGAEHRLSDQLLRPAPYNHAFALIPLDLIDFWRLDLRIVPGSMDNGTPMALVGIVSAPGLISSPFFGLSSVSSNLIRSESTPRSAALDAWLSSRRDLWQIRSGQDPEPALSLVLVTRYLRVVGQYALYAEVVRHDPSLDPISFAFNSNSDETETEVILAHWGLDRQLGGRILHVGGGQRRTVSLSSPIWYNGLPHATLIRSLSGTGFHRRLESSLLLDSNTPSPCQLSLKMIEFLPSGAYIDTDEIERLQRFTGVRISILGDPINIEAPESVSKQNVVVLHLDNITRDQVHAQWLNISIPIHLRYQPPAAAGQHAQRTGSTMP